jgi:hypothetical protein
MDKDRDLLPWILAGLLMAAAAIAITAASTQNSAPAAAPRADAAIAQNGPDPTPERAAPAAQVQIDPSPQPPINRIWECTTNGQRTFSNNPCGEKSSVREIGPINGMDPTPLLPPTRAYAPPTDYESDYADPSPPEAAESSYPSALAIPFSARRRPQSTHHHRAPMNRVKSH